MIWADMQDDLLAYVLERMDHVMSLHLLQVMDATD